MGVYLELEGIELTTTNDELASLGNYIACHAGLDEIILWIKNHCKY